MRGNLKQLGFQLDVAAAWMSPLRVELNTNLLKNGSVLSIGAANRELGLRASAWWKAWPAGLGVSFSQAREIGRKGARDDPEFRNQIMNLEGRRVACTCSLFPRCHGDVFIEVFEEVRADLLEAGCQDPPTDEEALAAAARQRTTWKQQRTKPGFEERQRPSQTHWVGEPITVGHAESKRPVSDGGGLRCLWPPERRYEPSGVARKIHDALDHELTRLDRGIRSGMASLLSELCEGRVQGDPFPKQAT